MITEIIINDKNKTPINYFGELKIFKNKKVFNFKSGVNILVGPNGSGKSTLFNLISSFFFCEDTMYSRVPNNGFEMPKLWKMFKEELLDGVDIKSDYKGLLFRYKPSLEMTKDNVLDNFDNFNLFINSRNASIGEQTIQALGTLFEKMFNDENLDLRFPFDKFKKRYNNCNESWNKKIKDLEEYYRRNTIKIEGEYQFTVLLDEPDRNLDIENINSIYNILSYKKPNTQIIAIIHNPILIYKLSKNKEINFIEFEKGYIDKIKNIIEKV